MRASIRAGAAYIAPSTPSVRLDVSRQFDLTSLHSQHHGNNEGADKAI